MFRNRIPHRAAVATFATTLLLASSAPALAEPASLTRVSTTSPYASCTLGAAPGTAVYSNDEVEASVAANPTTPKLSSANLIGVWQQDAWSNGAARGGVAASSFDGGTTWQAVPLPFSGCAPGAVVDPATGQSYDRVADDWVSIGPDGTAYTTATAGSVATLDNAVVAASSTDGGRTWQNAHVVQADAGTTSGSTHFFNDKDSVTADPYVSGTAYLVWDRLEAPNGFPLYTRSKAYRGPAMFSMTIDGGRSWSTPKVIADPGQNNQTLGNQIIVGSDGSLYDFFNELPHTGANSVAFVKSTDRGATWSAPQAISSNQSVGVKDPTTGAPVTTGSLNGVPAAVDPVSGTIYIAWQDARFSGGQYDEVALSSSTDGGAHWSVPVRVNAPTGDAAFNPALHMASDRTLGLTYYDFRNLAAGFSATLPTHYWLKKLPAGGSQFGVDIPIVPANQPFNLMAAPAVRGGMFVGDYEGLTSIGSDFVPLFVRTTCSDTSCVGGSNPTDVFSGVF